MYTDAYPGSWILQVYAHDIIYMLLIPSRICLFIHYDKAKDDKSIQIFNSSKSENYHEVKVDVSQKKKTSGSDHGLILVTGGKLVPLSLRNQGKWENIS